MLLEGRWKGLRVRSTAAPIALFDLSTDLGENTDLAAQNPEVVARIAAILREAHVDNEHWKL